MTKRFTKILTCGKVCHYSCRSKEGFFDQVDWRCYTHRIQNQSSNRTDAPTCNQQFYWPSKTNTGGMMSWHKRPSTEIMTLAIIYIWFWDGSKFVSVLSRIQFLRIFKPIKVSHFGKKARDQLFEEKIKNKANSKSDIYTDPCHCFRWLFLSHSSCTGSKNIY